MSTINTYTHFDKKKQYAAYKKLVANPLWVKSHGFFPFIHFQETLNKFVLGGDNKRHIKSKVRELHCSAHIDRFIYQYYSGLLNDKYNVAAEKLGVGRVASAYRNCFKGKNNIHFAKEAFEFIVSCGSAFVYAGDFSKFFDNLDHKYLKKQLKAVNEDGRLDDAEYAIFKNMTRFTYIDIDDIVKVKGEKSWKLQDLEQYFDSKEFRSFKKKYLKKHDKEYGIPQGAAISSVYANIYMLDFDKKLNDIAEKYKGLYRRYCDDIIFIVPINKEDFFTAKHEEILKAINDIKENVPGLILNTEKSEQYYYGNGVIKRIDKIDSDKCSFLSYLGFDFDGKKVVIRGKSLFKYYYRAYRKVAKIRSYKENKLEQAYVAGKKALYKGYTHLGAFSNRNKHGNFLTYAYKSHKIFGKSTVLESGIRSQVRRHWHKIENRLKAK